MTRYSLLVATAMIVPASASAQVAGSDAGATSPPVSDQTSRAPVPVAELQAQSADPGEIVVTAQRRTQNLQQVPISAAVVGGQALQRANLLNLESVAVRTPGVRISVAPISDFINIRGVGSSLNLGFEQSVATFVDGIYRGRSRSTRAALFDSDRVEVLKGPQTTFFGNNAIAGAFNITTRKPGDTLQANASAFFAPGTDEYTLEAGASVPVTSTLSVRAAGRASGMEGYVHNDRTGRDDPRLRDEVGRVSARWKPFAGVETNARFDIGHNRDRNQYSTQLTDCPPPPEFGGARGTCARYLAALGGTIDDLLDDHTVANPSFFRYDYHEAAQTTSIGIGKNALIFTTGYFHHKYDLLNDLSPIPAAQGGSVVGTTQSIPLRIFERYHQFSQEVRFQSDAAAPFSYLIGGYYSHDSLNIDLYQGFFQTPFGALAPAFYRPTTPITFRTYNTQQSETKSVFGSATARFVDVLQLNVGLRYSVVEKDASRIAQQGTSASVPGPDNFVAGPAAAQAIILPAAGFSVGDFAVNHRSDKKLLPAASVQYDITPAVMAYASYSRGFKAGGFSAYSSNSIFGPEKVDAYEIGVKSRLFDRKATLNVALFWSNYDDLQETTTIALPSGGARQVVGNVAKSRSRGVEIGATLRASGSLSLSTDFSYLDAIYLNYANAPCTALQSLLVTPCTQDLSGKRRAFAPEYSGNVSLDFTRRLTNGYRFAANATVYYTSFFFQQPLADPYLSQGGYAKVDGRVSLATVNDTLELAVVAKNLFDEQTASFRTFLSTSPGSNQALADPGRSVGFQVSYRY